MHYAGYFASALIGISLGIIGGGGSILTVPVLVYLFGVDASLATVYSLFVVGITSLTGSAAYFRQGLVRIRTALLFGVPSTISVLLTRAYVVPGIPDVLLSTAHYTLRKDAFLLLLFAVMMLLASFSMIRKRALSEDTVSSGRTNSAPLVLQGTAVGLTTGLVGAGGGFLIIPALVNLLNLPMKKAVGTSLFIISLNSLTGFLISLSNTIIQWQLLLTISGIAVAGILAGSHLGKRIDGKKLKPAFGWFVLGMGCYILVKETLLS